MLAKPDKCLNNPGNLRPYLHGVIRGQARGKMALTRLEWHLENIDQLAHTLIGFRKHVSAQDVAFMIHEVVYATPSAVQLRTIVAIDIKKAFDSPTDRHHATPGGDKPSRSYDSVHQTFLTNRTMRIPGPDGQPSERSPYIEEPPSV